MAGDDVVILVRVNDQTAAGFRDVNGRLRTMSGQYARAAGDMQQSSTKASASINGLKATLLSLAPAAVPVAAAMAPIVVQTGAATLAMAAFGAAVIPQISNLSDAAKAQTKYTDAVKQYGRGSKQAADAALAQQRTLASMPVTTQRAAVAWQGLRAEFKAFSDTTSDFTMVPVEKSFAVLGQIIPKLTPMARGAASQLDRLVTTAGGAVNTAGFQVLSDKVADFSNNALKGAIDRTISFSRALSEGNAHGPIASFFDYAREQGPAVKDLLTNVSEAVGNLMEGASQAGPGLLTLVNAMAKLVASVPPELVGNLLQVYAAFKLIKLAGAGIGAMAGGFATLGTSITALRAASTAAGGGLTGMNAALNTLSTGGKAMLAAGAVGALVLVMHQLSDNKAPVAVDELSTSLNELATTGKVTGALKGNFDEMATSIAMVSKGASDNGLATMISDFGTWSGLVNGPGISDATKNFDAWDKVMANNVKSGNPKLAASQFEILRKAWLAGGGDMDRLKEKTNDYQNALADQKFEAQMAAEAMGVFGTAAQNTSATLEAQKQSADGLRASIVALNEVNRSAYDAQIGFEAGLDALTASFKEHGATLNLDTEAGRANGQAMSQAAKSQDELIASGLAAGESLASMTQKSSELRESMMRLATEAFGGNTRAATEYVNKLLGVPGDIKTLVKLERESAIQGLHDVQAEITKTPGAKQITVSALNGAAIRALEAVGLKTRTLRDGRTAVYTANGQALGGIGAVARALANLDGRTANTWTTHNIKTSYSVAKSIPKGQSLHDMVGSANGNIFRGRSFANGGTEEHVAQIAQPTMRLWAEPETGGEAYIPLASSKRPRSMAILEDVADQFGYRLEKFAKGGKVTRAQQVAAARAKAQAAAQAGVEREARADLRGQFGVSRFGQMAGYQSTPFERGLGSPQDLGSLVSALSKARANIGASTHGRTESTLLRTLDSVGKRLIGQEKALGKVNASLEKAKDKLDSLKSSAAQLSDSVKGGVLSSANITRGASGSGPVTTASIMGGLTASRDKATAFAGALKDLKSKGLSASLIQQIGEANIEGGGLETAGALLGASGSEIDSINGLQSQINSAAGAAGRATSDAVYGQAIKAQTAAVGRLQKSQDRLERSMASLAKTLERAISRAIGKKAAGGIVGAAAAGGVRGGLTWVGEQEPELLDLPVGSRVWSGPDSRRKTRAPWESMLNAPRRAPSSAVVPAAVHGGGRQTIVVQLQVGRKSLGEVWVEVGQDAVRSHGSIEATLKPPRGR